VFCGRHLLAAKLRRSNIDASVGARDEVARIVGQIRARWPRVRILLRADSGFARDELMTWCEANGVDYVFGLARNERLVGAIASELAAVEAASLTQGGPARRFADFAWRTRDSWSRTRRVVAKAEHLPKSANPRFIVTSLPASETTRAPSTRMYCARGEIENRIKEQQLDLFADRTSAATIRANQLRLWFASFAYVLLDALRRIGLRHTQFAPAPPVAPSGSSS
jgi:Transposase DDE domain group 1